MPREFRGTGMFWAVIALIGLSIWAMLFLVSGSPDWWTRQDLRLMVRVEDIRTDAATAFFKGVNLLTEDLFTRAVRWGVILALIFYRRWRHLVAGMAVFLIVDLVTTGMVYAVARPRPLVEILVSWEGYSHPSIPVASLAATLRVIGYALIPKGAWRNRWFVASGVVLFLAVVSRIYLGVDHP